MEKRSLAYELESVAEANVLTDTRYKHTRRASKNESERGREKERERAKNDDSFLDECARCFPKSETA